MSPNVLDKILAKLPKGDIDKNLLVGYDSKDDAACYKIDEKNTIIETLDFFPSMVDDPYIFGKIAAANALSDVWAMGGKPIMALNIACFPEDIDKTIMEKVLVGGAEKVKEAGCTLAGGHTIVDPIIKYGLSVTGIVDTDKVRKNNDVKVGDKLIITKPLGIGIGLTANTCGVLKDGDYDLLIKSMQTLNKYAAEILMKYDVHGLTDVTGFGLLIHLTEMLSDKYSASLFIDKLPLVTPNIKEYAMNDYFTAASKRNEMSVKDKVDFGKSERWQELICFDPQTSGGLLVSVNSTDAEKALSDLKKLDLESAIIGEIIEKKEKTIIIK